MDMVFMWVAFCFIVLFKILTFIFWPLVAGVGGYGLIRLLSR
jgi:hypothetical protein